MNDSARDDPNRPGHLPRRAAHLAGPVRPKDSASMIVLRRAGDGTLEVLMGRRASRSVFGAVYVFPGGKVDAADRRAGFASELDEHVLTRISANRARARSFAVAAVRETFEETGLLLGAPGDVGQVGGAAWEAMRSLGVAADLARLRYVGHAITPSSRAVRFNARFFLAWEGDLVGELGGSGELDDLAFTPVKAALDRPLVDVTRFMLGEMLRRDSVGFAEPETYPFFTYRRDKRFCRYA